MKALGSEACWDAYVKGGGWEWSARASELNLLWALLKNFRCLAPWLPWLAGRDRLAKMLTDLVDQSLILWNILLNWVGPDHGFWRMVGSNGYSWELLQIRVFGFLRIVIFTWVAEFDVPISMSLSKSLPRSVQPLCQKMKAISIFGCVLENAYPGQCNPSVKKWKQFQYLHVFLRILTQVSAPPPFKNESNFNMCMCSWKCLPRPVQPLRQKI